VADPAGAQAAAADLAGAGGGHAVITLGRDGAVLAGPVLPDPVLADPVRADPGGPLAVPGFSVDSVDSVGAGDAFVAALGVAVASGVAAPEAVRLACAVAATAVTRPGAQESLPAGPDVLAATGVRWPLG
jgi:ribokinase